MDKEILYNDTVDTYSPPSLHTTHSLPSLNLPFSSILTHLLTHSLFRQVGYRDRRIALWQKYKTDLAIRMLPSEAADSRTSLDHSSKPEKLASSMRNTISVAMKPISWSQKYRSSPSRVESSVYVDTRQADLNDRLDTPNDKGDTSISASAVVSPRDKVKVGPFGKPNSRNNSNKETGGGSSSKSNKTLPPLSPRPFAGGGIAGLSPLPSIASGD